METETPTPTETPEPTITLTPTATFTPTPNYWVELTAEPTGLPARVGRETTIVGYADLLVEVAIFVSIWAMYFEHRLRGKK